MEENDFLTKLNTEDISFFIKNLIDTIADPVLVLDSDFDVILLNGSFSQQFKINSSLVKSLNFIKLNDGLWEKSHIIQLLKKKLLELNLPQNSQIELQKEQFAIENFQENGYFIDAKIIVLNDAKQKIVILTFREFEHEANQDRYRIIFDKAAIGIVEVDTRDHFITVNSQICHMLGYSQEELLKLDVHRLTYEKDQSLSDIVNKKIHQGESEKLSYEKRYLKRDGTPIWVNVTVAGIYDKNNIHIGSVGTIEDISERKQVEIALRESEERFRTLADNISQLAWMADKDGNLFWYNKRWYEYTGTTPDEMKGDGWKKIHHPEWLDKVIESFSKAIKNGTPWEYTFPMRNKNGEYKWFLTRALPIHDDNKNIIRWFGTNTDISENVRIEHELRESKAKLEAAMSSMTDAVFISDMEGNFIDFNDAFATFHKFKNKEECAKTFSDYPKILSVYFLDGKEAPIDMWAVPRALRGEIRTNEEYRFKRKDTGETWVGSYSFSPIKSDNGEIVGSVVVARDITNQKKLDEQLTRERELLQTIFDSIPVMIVVYDPHGQGIEVNKAFEKITGYSKKDADYQVLLESIYPDSEYRNKVLEYIQSLAPGFKNLQMIGKNGNIIESAWANVKIPDGRLVGIGLDISERSAAEKELKIAGERFKRITSSNIIGCAIADTKGNFVFANDYFLNIVGYTREEYDQGMINWLKLTPNEYHSLDYKSIDELRKNGKTTPYEKEYIRKDSSRAWVLIANIILPGPEELIFAFVLDITNAKKTLEDSQARRAEIESILESLPDGYVLYNIDGTIRKMNELARKILKFTPEDLKKPYKKRISEIILLKTDGSRYSLDELPSSRALNGETIHSVVIKIDHEDNYYWLSVSASPIVVQKKLIGAIMEFSDITALHDLQDELTRERNFVDAVLQTSGALIVVIDVHGLIIKFNKACEDATGYKQDEVLNKNFVDLFIPEEEKTDLLSAAARLFKGQSLMEYENHWKTRSGEKRFIRWRNTVLLDSKGLVRFAVATGIDITERRKFENALKESEYQFRQLTESLPQMVWVTRPDGYHEYFNQQWYNFTGTSPGETQGELWAKLLHPDDFQRTLDTWHKSLETGEPYNIEYRFRSTDGEYRWFLGKALPLRNAEGKITRWFGTCTDIHNQKLIEKAIRESEERFRLVNKATHDIIWDWDLLTNKFDYNESVLVVLNLDSKSKLTTIDEWFQLIHPEDRMHVIESIRNAIDTGEKTWNREYRFGPEGGPYRIYLDRGLIARDSFGKAYRMIGSMLDLTERKAIEKEREKILSQIAAERKRLDIILHQLPAGVMIADLSGRITYVNEYIMRLFSIKYYRDDYRNLTERWQPFHNDKTPFTKNDSPLFRAINGQQTIGTEMHFKRKNGNEWLIAEVNSTPIYDTNGNVVEAMIALVDITQRKLAEDALKNRTDELIAANQEMETFSFSVSHDLRNPLNIISSFAEFLREDYSDKLGDEGRENIERIVNAADKAKQLISDILNLSRIGRQEMKLEQVNLSIMVNSLLNELSSNEPNRKTEFIIEPGIIISADAHLIHIAIENLLRNAWKFTSKRELTTIEFGSILRDEKRIFFIKDNGAGFDKKFAKAIFEPFKRVHSESQFTGTGIGLSIVQRVINRHGGRIWADGEYDKGATFFFSI